MFDKLAQFDPEITAARNVDRETIPDAVTQLSDSILRRCIDTRQPLIVGLYGCLPDGRINFIRPGRPG